MFNCISKVSILDNKVPALVVIILISLLQGLAIVIILVTGHLAKENIDQTIDDYSYDSSNMPAINELKDSKGALSASIGLNSTLIVFMVANFVLSAFTLGKPLREKKVDAQMD